MHQFSEVLIRNVNLGTEPQQCNRAKTNPYRTFMGNINNSDFSRLTKLF